MATAADIPSEERILQLLHHLGIQQAHFAARVPEDWIGLAAKHPEIISSLTLVCPSDVDPAALGALSSRLLVVTGDIGPPAEAVQTALSNLADATLASLSSYPGFGLSDIVADRTEDMALAMTSFLGQVSQQTEATARLSDGEGEVAGITYRIQGSGPPLVLLPLALAPSQWEPLLPRLSQSYCTITLGGPRLGFVSILEERGRSGSVGLARTLMDEAHLRPSEAVLDVGCGTGVLDRWLARRTGRANRIVGLDISLHLVREATVLARRESLQGVIQFLGGNAEALPFPDNSFNVAMSVTVMDFVDADRMLAEMVRVTVPGGRVAVAVRAVDMPSLANLPVRASLKTKVEAMMSGYVDERGCADASLYRRFQQAGLIHVKMLPQMAVFDDRQNADYLQRLIQATLSPEEADEWQAAETQAKAARTFFIARPHHCAVGTKP